jgi:hypothetical protein
MVPRARLDSLEMVVGDLFVVRFFVYAVEGRDGCWSLTGLAWLRLLPYA